MNGVAFATEEVDRMSRSMRRAGSIVFALAILLTWGAGVARADTPIEGFNVLPSTTEAGAHPDVSFSFTLKNRMDQHVEGHDSICDCEDAKNITVHLPTGLIGNLPEPPQCSAAQFSNNECPVDSQVGVVEVRVSSSPGNHIPFISPVYKMVPHAGQAGLTAFKIGLFEYPQFVILSSRTDSDYGIDATVTSIWHILPIHFYQQVMWGVPADPVHDPLRFPFGESQSMFEEFCQINGQPPTEHPSTVQRRKNFFACNTAAPGVPSNSPERPFLQNPTTCGVPLTSSIDVLSYDTGKTHAEAPYPATTECEKLPFNPSLAAQPTTKEADAASGLDVQLKVPQPQSPTVPSPSEIKGTTVTLPPGFSINPSAADGKTSCSNESARFGRLDQAQCPEFAKIGTVTVESAVLPGKLPGFIYLGEPEAGNRYRLFVVVDGFGIHVKLPGTMRLDPVTGQVVTIFKDLPQTPFTEFDMHFFGSEKGVLATPTRCGTYPIRSTFEPWNSALPNQESTQFFTIDSGPGGAPCPGEKRPFEPGFAAGSAGNTPAAHSSYSVEVSRPDGDQFLAGLNVSPPPGFAANLNGIPYCPETAIAALGNPLYSGLAELAASACPAKSQIGTVTAGAGAGSKPLFVGGKVYLAGPYKGAPLSLVAVVPAVSGPYDIGNVVDRAAIEVDPVTARVTTVADPLPQILDGIPLRTRKIRVDIDRPKFALTGTDCSPSATEATISGDEGASAQRSARYQLANCAKLPFGPKLSLKLSGGTKRSDHPALRAVLSAGRGEANLAGASVALPRSEFLDQDNIRTICTRVQFAAGNCPGGAIYGHARAFTPILDEPLEGPVYLRSSNNQLPDMVMDLHGQVDFNAIARIDSVRGGIRSTFEFLPDVPISKVVLSMQGGKKGLLENSRNLCAGKAPVAKARLTAQNGKRLNKRVPLRTSCRRGGGGAR